MTVWYGLFAPAGADPAIVARIYHDLAVTLRDPAMRARLAQVHLVSVVGSTPPELAVFLGQEIERYSAIVKGCEYQSGIKPAACSGRGRARATGAVSQHFP